MIKMQIVKEELQFDDSLKKRLEFICEFSKVAPTNIVEDVEQVYLDDLYIILKNIMKNLIVF